MATSSTRRLLAGAALLLATVLPATAGGWETVQIELPVPPKLDTTGLQTILVASFVTNEHPTIDLNREITRFMRRVLESGTRFEIIDVRPPAIPEQPLDELLANDVFWKKLGRDFGADLIVSGRLLYETRDRSGFVQEDVINPTTQQKVRRTRYAEREEYLLEMNVFFFKGDNGAFLYEDTFKDNALLEGGQYDALQVLYDLIDGIRREVLGILIRQTRVEPRYVWTE
jgi:hypothetical protein